MTHIYLASSWRNEGQRAALLTLRNAGHPTYDFRNPEDNWRTAVTGDSSGGFRWSDIDEEWERWSPWAFRVALHEPISDEGFRRDFDAMQAADVGILLLPSGRSAHIEAGYFAGHPDKRLFVVVDELPEPELMYRLADGVFLSIDELLKARVL